MNIEDALMQLYSPRLALMCMEYLEGITLLPPSGYADASLKGYWEQAGEIIKQAIKD